jgi:hypothetical protein
MPVGSLRAALLAYLGCAGIVAGFTVLILLAAPERSAIRDAVMNTVTDNLVGPMADAVAQAIAVPPAPLKLSATDKAQALERLASAREMEDEEEAVAEIEEVAPVAETGALLAEVFPTSPAEIREDKPMDGRTDELIPGEELALESETIVAEPETEMGAKIAARDATPAPEEIALITPASEALPPPQEAPVVPGGDTLASVDVAPPVAQAPVRTRVSVGGGAARWGTSDELARVATPRAATISSGGAAGRVVATPPPTPASAATNGQQTANVAARAATGQLATPTDVIAMQMGAARMIATPATPAVTVSPASRTSASSRVTTTPTATPTSTRRVP